MCVGSDRTGASAPSAPDAGGYSFAAGAGEASERRTTATSNARHARAQTRAALTVRASTNRLETDKEAHPTPRVGGPARQNAQENAQVLAPLAARQAAAILARAGRRPGSAFCPDRTRACPRRPRARRGPAARRGGARGAGGVGRSPRRGAQRRPHLG